MNKNIQRKEHIWCDIRLCVVGENCDFVRKDSHCSKDEPGYGYRVFGQKFQKNIQKWNENEPV